MGAPKGPRTKPQVLHDDEGSYTVFTGKHCCIPGCKVQLTSRNRYGKTMLCKEHGREWERSRTRKPRQSAPRGPRKGTPKADEQSIRIADPAWRKVHSALSNWLAFPTEPAATARLQAALTDHELAYRLKQALPWVPSPSGPLAPIPVDEPEFRNPEHRTTRLEFLSDCSTHGV